MLRRTLASSTAALVALLGLGGAALAAPRSQSMDPSVVRSDCWRTSEGLSLQFDNDLLAGGPHDADYTGGIAVQWTPRRQSPLHPAHRAHWYFDRMLGLGGGSCRRHAWQLGLVSFTPGTLRSSVPVLDDRPFASLVVLGTSATWNTVNPNVAMTSMVQIGALGLGLAEGVHRLAHRLVGDELPQGYQFQVSDGGELTVRYVLARHQLLGDGLARGETLQVKNSLALSVGYLTEASAGLSARWGRIASPWQSFTPGLADYLPAASPLPAVPEHELYVFGGVRLKARAYSALAQGQFRDSVHVLRSSELEPFLAEVFVGLHWQPSPGWEITYIYRVQTPELRVATGRRTLVWGGLNVSRRF